MTAAICLSVTRFSVERLLNLAPFRQRADIREAVTLARPCAEVEGLRLAVDLPPLSPLLQLRNPLQFKSLGMN